MRCVRELRQTRSLQTHGVGFDVIPASRLRSASPSSVIIIIIIASISSRSNSVTRARNLYGRSRSIRKRDNAKGRSTDSGPTTSHRLTGHSSMGWVDGRHWPPPSTVRRAAERTAWFARSRTAFPASRPYPRCSRQGAVRSTTSGLPARDCRVGCSRRWR